MAGKSPAERGKEGAVSKLTPMQRFIDQLEMEASIGDDQGESIGDIILERMAAATTIEEVFEAQNVSLPSGKSLVDTELTVQGFDVRKGDPQYEEGGCGYYFIIDAVNPSTGEAVKFATGAMNILALLHNLRVRGNLPVTVAIRGKQTAKGTLLTMRMVGPRIIQTQPQDQ